MKVHRPVLILAPSALKEIFEQGRYSDKVLEKIFKANKKWGGRDRRFFAELVYDMVRWWRRLWFVFGREPSFDEKSLLQLIGVYLITRQIELPDWPEWKTLKSKNILARWNDQEAPRAIRESIPDWLDSEGERQLKQRWPDLLSSLNQAAAVVLRVNTLKTSRTELKKAMGETGIITDFVEGLPDGLVLQERVNVFTSEFFKKGWFEVQDASSQRIAPLLQVEPGHRVWDACAGAGGKSLHLAALMKNKGKIVATDIHQWKLDELRKRATRDGVDIIETRLIESHKTAKRFEGKMDRVLLDVPCSGLGVVRRNPDTKWKLTPDELSRLNELQFQLLSHYEKAVKPGGKMVYSTCSIFPSENELLIERFLKAQPENEWRIEETLHCWPDRDGYDGFFGIRLARRE